jgi:hypothetical protein
MSWFVNLAIFLLISIGTAASAEAIKIRGLSLDMSQEELISGLIDYCRAEKGNIILLRMNEENPLATKRMNIKSISDVSFEFQEFDGHLFDNRFFCEDKNEQTLISVIFSSEDTKYDSINLPCEAINSCDFIVDEFAKVIADRFSIAVMDLHDDFHYVGRGNSGEEVKVWGRVSDDKLVYSHGISIRRGLLGNEGLSLD